MAETPIELMWGQEGQTSTKGLDVSYNVNMHEVADKGYERQFSNVHLGDRHYQVEDMAEEAANWGFGDATDYGLDVSSDASFWSDVSLNMGSVSFEHGTVDVALPTGDSEKVTLSPRVFDTSDAENNVEVKSDDGSVGVKTPFVSDTMHHGSEQQQFTDTPEHQFKFTSNDPASQANSISPSQPVDDQMRDPTTVGQAEEVMRPRASQIANPHDDIDARMIRGDNSDNELCGDGADNFIFAGSGDDVAHGGLGADWMAGDAGDDRLYGGEGNDHILGGQGNDFLYGGADDDVLSGGDGFDRLYGEAGNDRLSGGAGNDYLYDNAGNNYMDGGEGSDYMYGYYGQNDMSGGSGNDYMMSYYGDATMSGGEGNDLMLSYNGWPNYSYYNHYNNTYAPGDAVMDGGEGNDRMYNYSGNADMTGGAGNDYMMNYWGNADMAGGDGNDIMYNFHGQATMDGGEGNDSLIDYYGGSTMNGGDGNDTLTGYRGGSIMFGGVGDDTIRGGTGNDTITGGVGDDRMSGGAGSDQFIVDALSGNDTIDGGSGATWIDVISLQGEKEGPAANINDGGWTLAVENNATYTIQNDVVLFDNNDVSGRIMFENGNEIAFTGIEQIQW